MEHQGNGGVGTINNLIWETGFGLGSEDMDDWMTVWPLIHFSLIQQIIYLLLCSSSCIHTDTNICTCTHICIARDDWNKIDKINLILFSGKYYK